MNQNEEQKKQERDSFIEDAFDAVTETASSIGDGLADTASGIAEGVGAVVGGIFEGLGSL